MIKKLVKMLKHPRYDDFLALIAGILLPFAFAPFEFYPLAVLSPALLLITWLNCSVKRAMWRGFLFGLGFFGVGASWIYVSIHEYGNTGIFLSSFITIIFVLILSLFPTAQGYLLARFFPRNNISKLCLAFPCTWVLLEWVRSWFLTGFPWLILGTSQLNSPLRGLAPIVGQLGLSFILTLSGALFIVAIKSHRRHWYKSIVLLILIWCGAFALTPIQWTHAQNKPVTVSLVQGNIPQELKWSPGYLKTTLDIYFKLSYGHWKSQLVIWPEAAIPLLLQDAQGFVTSMGNIASDRHATFITGIPVLNGFTYYNSMLISENNQQQLYYKRHLVPFGEYVPFSRLLRGMIGFFSIPMSDFSPGPAIQPDLKAAGMIIAPFICYEVAYESSSLAELPRANLLITLSNDAWFDRSFASAQHLELGRFRALETGRYHLFVTNTGITAIINPQGIVQASIPVDQPGVLTGTIQSMYGATPIVILGLTPFIILFFCLLLIAWLLQIRARNNSK